MANQKRQHGSRYPKCIDIYISDKTLVVVNKATNQCHLNPELTTKKAQELAHMLLKDEESGVQFKPNDWAVTKRIFF